MLPTSRHGQIKSRTTTLGQCDNGGSGAWRRRRGCDGDRTPWSSTRASMVDDAGCAWCTERGWALASLWTRGRGCGLEDGFPDFGGFRA
ncbi:hypothetical protein U1Q18_046216 [Sarracenia purpurea var. burkii]